MPIWKCAVTLQQFPSPGNAKKRLPPPSLPEDVATDAPRSYTDSVLNSLNQPNGAARETLCLACGLCCNGVLFADVKLRAGDSAARARLLELPTSPTVKRAAPASPRVRALPQPCPAFDGCRCRIYADRPQHCRAFECLLLQAVKAGRLQPSAALRTIRHARRRAARVEHLLGQLGDTEVQLTLKVRFRRTSERLEQIGADRAQAELYAQLTLAVHQLNLLLSEAFYPEPG